MQPAQTPPVAPAAVPAAVPKKTPIDMSALKLKMSASVARTLAAAGVLPQRPRPAPEAADEDALLGLAPMRPPAAAPVKVAAVAPPRKVAPPPAKVRKVERSSSTSSSDDDSSSGSSSDSSSGEDESSSEDDSASDDESASSAVSEREATLFDIARSQGLVNKDVLTQEEEEAPASLVPPRPPVVRSFPSDIAKTLERYRERLNREENLIRIKDDNKAVSLGTSKINYIDPRIVCSWAKAHDVPINKVFSATIVKKFPWAMNVENFDF